MCDTYLVRKWCNYDHGCSGNRRGNIDIPGTYEVTLVKEQTADMNISHMYIISGKVSLRHTISASSGSRDVR